MKIAYVAVWREAGVASGVLKKVRSQISAWIAMGHDARLFLIHDSSRVWDGLASVPLSVFRVSRPWTHPVAAERVGRAVVQWRPDAVYLRHATYYPAWERLAARCPTFLEINTNEVSEDRARAGAARRRYSEVTRSRMPRKAAGIVCVTRELARLYSAYGKPTCAVANGIDLAAYPPLDPPDNAVPRLVFSGSADPDCIWHGVDKVIMLASRVPDMRFDIVGPDLRYLEPLPRNVTGYGVLDGVDYRRVLAAADVGIGSLALHRIDMLEASPLKVREYLAFGLPVVLGYTDTDVPEPSSYALSIPNEDGNVLQNACQIADFASTWRGKRVPRDQVAHLDVKVKESERLAFMSRVVATGR